MKLLNLAKSIYILLRIDKVQNQLFHKFGRVHHLYTVEN